MNDKKYSAGFVRLDMTPPLGVDIPGGSAMLSPWRSRTANRFPIIGLLLNVNKHRIKEDSYYGKKYAQIRGTDPLRI